MIKRIYFTLLLSLLSVFSVAQNDREHMKFMGIPLGGPIHEFVNTLCEQKGFEKGGISTITETGETVYTLKGNFWKFENCDISVVESLNKTAYKVRVSIFDLSIYKYKINIEDLIENLTIKYGTYEIDHDPGYENDEFLIWRTNGGTIKYKENYIPQILNALYIEYVDCDIKEYLNQKKQEIEDL